MRLLGNSLDSRYDKYFYKGVLDKKDKISDFISIAKKNAWIYYFSNCDAEIKGWIDFENEMLPICRAFDCLFNADFKAYTPKERESEMAYDVVIESWYDMLNLLLWNDIILKIRSGKTVFLKEKYASPKQGILQARIIKTLRSSFEEFKLSMILYMMIFVDELDSKFLPQIKGMNPNAILSFNYTETEKKYFSLKDDKICHVHGSVELRQIVLGTDLIADDSKYIFLNKQFQRLTCVKEFGYKRLLDAMGNNSSVDIVGHSLNINDEHIFKPFIEKSNKTNIYYYDDEDFGTKIANLLKIFGSDKIEDWIYCKKIVFKKLKNI